MALHEKSASRCCNLLCVICRFLRALRLMIRGVNLNAQNAENAGNAEIAEVRRELVATQITAICRLWCKAG